LINNIEFDNHFKELLRKWISTKVEIQKYLGELDRQIRVLKDKIVKSYEIEAHQLKALSNIERASGINNELALQILQSNIQNIISQGIDGFKKINENFNVINSKFVYFIKRNKYVQAKKLIKMKSAQIQSFVEETERQFDNIIEKEICRSLYK